VDGRLNKCWAAPTESIWLQIRDRPRHLGLPGFPGALGRNFLATHPPGRFLYACRNSSHPASWSSFGYRRRKAKGVIASPGAAPRPARSVPIARTSSSQPCDEKRQNAEQIGVVRQERTI